MSEGEKLLGLINEIGSIGSTKEKERILTENKDVEHLKEVLYLVESPRIKFYIKHIPEKFDFVSTSDVKPMKPFGEHLESLKALYNREVTGHAALNHIFNMFLHSDKDTEILLRRIITKDLRMNLGTKIMNNVYGKDFIETTPYQGAKPFSRKLVDKLLVDDGVVLAQLKMDGCYSNALVIGGEISFVSRQGEIQNFGENQLKKELLKMDDCIFNGELTLDGEPNRAKANGIITSLNDIYSKMESRSEAETQKKINKFIKEKGMTLEEASSRIRYTVWDMLTPNEYFDKKSIIPYNERLNQMVFELENNKVELVQVVETVELTTFKDIMDYYLSKVEQGLEGIIVKGKYSQWKDGKPNWAIKIKEEIHLDLKITGYRFGSGKNAEVISSIEVESEDGLLKTVPTGLKELEMDDFTKNADAYMGKIIEVKCSGLSTDKDGNYSVLHPVYIEKRFDKDTANTLAECLEIVESSRNQ